MTGEQQRKTKSAKGEQARRKLKRAAMVVMERVSYNDMRVTDVTKEAGVAAGLFYHYFKDLKLVNNDLAAKNWFKAAIFFNVISSIGTFYLAYMMASKHFVQDLYLSSIYYYLHFQYNGWFIFACIGLFF